MPPVFRIFKRGGPKAFSYQPRYYDPEQEEREKRRQMIEREVEQERAQGHHDPEGFRERMRSSWQTPEAKGQAARANLRLLIILALLFLFVYTIFLYLERF